MLYYVQSDDDGSAAIEAIAYGLNKSSLKKALVLMRGMSGGGKSTFARALEADLGDDGPNYVPLSVQIVSADNYMLDTSGRYQFRADKLQQAHDNCLSAARNSMSCFNVTIVDNTNLLGETDKYIRLLSEVDIGPCWIIKVLCDLNKKSVHNVPEHTLAKQRKCVETILSEYGVATGKFGEKMLIPHPAYGQIRRNFGGYE